jgi:hypothetical protein
LPEAPPAVLQASNPKVKAAMMATEANTFLGADRKAAPPVRLTSIFLTVFFIAKFFYFFKLKMVC